MSWVYPRAYSHLDMPEIAHLGGIQVRSAKHIKWLLSMWSSQCLGDFLEWPNSSSPLKNWDQTPFRGSSFSATCMHRLVLSVATLSSWLRVKFQVHANNKPTAFLSCSARSLPQNTGTASDWLQMMKQIIIISLILYILKLISQGKCAFIMSQGKTAVSKASDYAYFISQNIFRLPVKCKLHV